MSFICTQCQASGEPTKEKRGYAAFTWILAGVAVAAWGLQELHCSLDVLCSSKSIEQYSRYETPVGLRIMGGIGLYGWLLHVVFRSVTKRKVCPSCGAADSMIPAGSPRAQMAGAGGAPAIRLDADGGDPTKKCPSCAELVKAEAIKCRFCGEALAA